MSAARASEELARAQVLHRAGQLREAEREYHNALVADPALLPALHLRGVVLAQLGALEPALALLQQAATRTPGDGHILNNLGRVQLQSGDTAAAEQSFRRALAAAPRLAEAAFNLGNLCRSAGRGDEAEHCFRQTLALAPGHAGAHYNLGNLQRERGNHRSALDCLQQAVQLRPGWADARNNYGTALLEWDRVAEAREQFAEAARLDPASVSAQRNLAQTLDRLGEPAASRAAYARLQQLEPGNPLHALTRAAVFPLAGATPAEIAEFHAGLHAALDGVEAEPPPGVDALAEAQAYPPFLLNYLGLDDLALRRRYAALAQRSLPDAPPPVWAHDRPHLGFVVTAGHEGVFIKCMRGLIGALDRARFRVTVVTSGANGRRILEPALAACGPLDWMTLSGKYAEMGAALRAAEFDLLYWWEVGSDATNYFLPFYRAARVQCTSWGWPCSSGIPAMDVFLSAEGLETAGAEARYSERLLRLRRLPVHYARPPVPAGSDVRARLGIGPERNLYLCQQNLRKVHPDFDALVAGILRADPAALIAFLGDAQPGVTRLLEARLRQAVPEGGERIVFLPRQGEADYLGLLHDAEVALDTPHYGGGANTVYDAFACGTPLVTLPDARSRSRYAAAAYAQMGVAGPVAVDGADYVRQAVALATDPDARRHLSAQITAGLPQLLDDDAAVREFEAALLGLLG